MAKIEVQSAFVEDVLSGDRGVWGLRVSEPHSRKNDQGVWETVARTFRTLRVGRDSGIDLSGFVKGDRVTFSGTERTEVRESEGRKFYNLVVWADDLTRVEGRGGPQPGRGASGTTSAGDWASGGVSGAQAGADGSWATTEVPF